MTPHIFELPSLDRRRFCECCGYPSLSLPDNVDGTPEWDFVHTTCDLCEWESVPLTPDGEPRESSEEERNDGLTLEAARERLAIHRSIYDPANLPAWKLSPPTAAVDDARDVLRVAYQDAMDAPLEERWAPWESVLAAERVLGEALRVQSDVDEALIPDEPFDQYFSYSEGDEIDGDDE